MVKNTQQRTSRAEMGKQGLEIKPVLAWIEPELEQGHGDLSEAMISAMAEEQRIRNKQHEKEYRLKKFQEDVKKRVQTLVRLKRQQQLQKSLNAVEMERNVVKQSAFAAENATPKKDRCLMRNNETSLSLSADRNDNNSTNTLPTQQRIEEHIHQVHKHTRRARRNLMNRKVVSHDYLHDDLPGGIWRETSTRENPLASRLVPLPDQNTELNVDLEPTLPCDETYTDNVVLEEERAQAFQNEKAAKVVRFEDQNAGSTVEASRMDRMHRRSVSEMMGSDSERLIQAPPNIYPGVGLEENKKQLQTQRAMYRRLFMDIEREQVKENMRRKEHRTKIAKLKKDKERLRYLEEKKSYALASPKDPVTNENIEDIYRREVKQQANLRKALEKQTKEQQKQKETARYVEALRRNLKDKLSARNITLPPLCCCGESVWDTHPDLCANNCVFYKNPKAYTKALQSLIQSCDSL